MYYPKDCVVIGNTMENVPQLLPCPFCGSPAEHYADSRKKFPLKTDSPIQKIWFLPSERLPEDESRVWVEYPNGVQSSYVWFRSGYFMNGYGMIILNVQKWKPYEE